MADMWRAIAGHKRQINSNDRPLTGLKETKSEF